ncbi:BON domain-containing protein [Candidatus Bathyarchaeota archaeon]|nr:BON domain-containing protein [Candidatus Bathyarchaeota archaeon]
MVKSTELKKQDVIDELTWDSKVDASQIQVKVEDGVVTLSGTVRSYSERIDAERDAWSVRGVKDVKNDIEINLTKGVTYPDDKVLQRRIENILIWDQTFDSLRISVAIKDGLVTLKGAVDRFWKIRYAINKIKGISGVKGIDNQLAVVPKKKMSDEMIAKAVMDSITRKSLISTEDITVKVKDGVVSLYGTVPTWNAWRQAHISAENTGGVLGIDDSIMIAS